MRRQYAAIGWKWKIAVVAFALALIGPGSASARSTGIDTGQMQQGPVTCSGIGCHLNAFTDDVFVTITGPQALVVDETANYTIEIFENVPGALQAGAGLNVVAFLDEVLTGLADGILGEDAANLQLTGPPFFFLDGQLTHVSARSLNPDMTSIGVFSYDFTVTAPSDPGLLELRGAMNAFNNNGNQLGENWNNTSLFITVPEPGAHALTAAALATLAAFVRAAALRRRRAC